jgi:uncharacterized protein (TIGR00730 family)
MRRRKDGTIDPVWIAEEAAKWLDTAPSNEARQVGEMLATSLKLVADGADLGQLKLMNHALKEMRYAYLVFNKYKGVRKASIFGSARTPADHPDYEAARSFGKKLADSGWMAITGAGDGIMKAGHEGPKREASFGLSIRLPFETTANDVIDGDDKLINFRYFFTRKLMFVSHSDAIAVFPGGFGTQDELFESLTLMQTGKSNIVPVVLVQGEGSDYWQRWERGITENLLDCGWISPEDPVLYYIAENVDQAVDHVLNFYRRFRSARYVGNKLVFRIDEPLSEAQVAELGREFKDQVASGEFEQSGPLPGELEHLELPRLHFHHVRRSFGMIRKLIDRINDMPRASET